MTLFDLNHITLYCQSLINSIAFYNQQLGIELLQLNQHQGYALLNSGNCRLVLRQIEEKGCEKVIQQQWQSQKQGISHIPEGTPSHDQKGRIILSLSCEDAEASYHELKAKGLHFIDQPTKQFWGGIQATMIDPDGHLLYLVSSRK